MPTFLQRPPRSGATKLRPQSPRAPQAVSLPDARTPNAATRVETRPACAAVLRPIDLERRARFARVEADAPRGA